MKPECGWETHCIGKRANMNTTEDTNSNNDNQTENEDVRKECEEKDISVDDFVIVQYDERCYPAKVIEINDRDKAVRLIFMQECEKVKRKFKWPANEDIVWVKTDEIVKKMNAPVATSRAGRMFAFPEDVFDLLDE